MSQPSSSSASLPALPYRILIFTVLTVLFTLLHYMGSALYALAGGLTTVKPYSGVALALILMLGDDWLWPVLAAGTLGGMMAKYAGHTYFLDMVTTPTVTSATVLAVHLTARRLIGRTIDFRAWRQLVAYITISVTLSLTSATLFTLVIDGLNRPHLALYWQAWFIPTALSYVIFTPVMMLIATAGRRALRANGWRLAGCMTMMAAVLALNFVPLRLPLLFDIPMALLITTLVSGLEGAALGLVLTEFVLTASATLGAGPSAISYLSLGYQLYFIQIFMAVLIAVMLPVAAAIAERTRLRDSMARALEREAHVNAALRASEQHARDMAIQAQAANNAKSEFLASMSHELRTPLNAILGFSEILKSELYGPLGHAKYVEYSEDVFKSGAHLLDLINDVLDLSKIDAGRMELRESTFQVCDLIDEAVHLMSEKAAGHVAIHLAVDDTLQLHADKRLIKQVVLNLLSNAIKFTLQGGTVTVSAQSPHGAGLEISVTDTGIGMNAAQLRKAFSHYGQIDSKIARAHQGTGLGLPISQSLARLHGGDLLAHSVPGEGTRMTLSLPAHRLMQPAARMALSAG
ncbi:MAG TPA: ATP-binding protein [Rhizomicrobium sp.]|nr:ATP-binding protein [Rhizomicrobium sp.]